MRDKPNRSFFSLCDAFEERGIAHHSADTDSFGQTHTDCLCEARRQKGGEGDAIEEGDPKGIEDEGTDDFGEEDCEDDLADTLFLLEEEAIAEADEEGGQREAGEECADGEQNGTDDIGDETDETCAEGTEQNACQGDREEGEAELQVPEAKGEEAGEDDLHGDEHGGEHEAMG